MRGWSVMLSGLLLQGCYAGSVEPWFPASDRIEPPSAALGRWVGATDGGEGEVLEVVAGTQRSMRARLVDRDDGYGLFEVSAARIGGTTFLDSRLSAEDPSVREVKSYVVRPHFLIKAELDQDELRLFIVDREWLARKLKRSKLDLGFSPKLLPVKEHGGDEPDMPSITTLPTAELRKLLVRLAKESGKDVYGTAIVYRRSASR